MSPCGPRGIASLQVPDHVGPFQSPPVVGSVVRLLRLLGRRRVRPFHRPSRERLAAGPLHGRRLPGGHVHVRFAVPVLGELDLPPASRSQQPQGLARPDPARAREALAPRHSLPRLEQAHRADPGDFPVPLQAEQAVFER